MTLVDLDRALNLAFGELIATELCENDEELMIQIGTKQAWINEDGELMGEASRPNGSIVS